MKRLILFVLFATELPAQLIVNDPLNTAANNAIQAGQAANHVEVLRRWAENLEKLNQQLLELQAQLAEQRRIREVIGDPATAGQRITTEILLTTELAREYGETIAALRRVARAVDSLRFTATGIFAELDDRTVLNRPFNRQTAPYVRYGAVEQHAQNLERVFVDSGPRLLALGREVGDTMAQLKRAPTQSEADKLHAKIDVLNGQIVAIELQRQDAAIQLHAQQILNDNQAAKERQDLLEKQIADERSALDAIGVWQGSLQLKPTRYSQP